MRTEEGRSGKDCDERIDVGEGKTGNGRRERRE